MKIEKPKESDLQSLVDLGAMGTTEADWIEKLLSAIRAQLVKSPIRYRGYGPYWWPLKKMFIDREDYEFGEYIDAAWLKATDYGQEKFNMAAAFLYVDTRFEHTNIYEPHHQMNDEDGEPIDFISNDEDMEIRGR